MFKKLKSVLSLVTKDIIGIDPIDVNSKNDVSIRDATDTQKGSVLLSTDTMTIGGVGNTCVTPLNLKAKLGVQTPNLVAVGKGNAQAIDWWSFYSSDSSVTIDPDISNKRFNIRTAPVTPVVKARFKAFYSANTPINIPAGSNYILVPNTKAFDDTNSFNTGTGTFIAPANGDYIFYSCVQAASIGLSLLTPPRIQVYAQTSTEIARIEDRVFNVLISLGGIYVSTGNTGIMRLTAGQALQLHLIISNTTGAYAISGGSLTSGSTTVICGHQL